MSLISILQGHLAWGDKPLLDSVDLTVEEGQRIGLIGRNGTGKSSLMKVLALGWRNLTTERFTYKTV